MPDWLDMFLYNKLYYICESFAPQVRARDYMASAASALIHIHGPGRSRMNASLATHIYLRLQNETWTYDINIDIAIVSPEFGRYHGPHKHISPYGGKDARACVKYYIEEHLEREERIS